MRLAAFILSMVLASGTAVAFDCVGVTFPPTVVICSDPELMRLTDERQAAINDARSRIGEQAWPALWDDQKRWVRSYASACGVAPDRPPPDPVPASVKECFRQAGLARISFLRAYGVSVAGAPVQVPPGTAATTRIGPSYDCTKVSSPLALMICGDPNLSRLDLKFGQAYWALFQEIGSQGQPRLKEADIAFIDQVQAQCGLSPSAQATAPVSQSRDCVENAYEKMRAMWIDQLSGPAREEAVRAPEQHVKLQQDLRQLGFLAPGPVDGVYGQSTRAAILGWQSARGRPITGFLGDADARRIEQEALTTTVPESGRSGTEALGAEDISLKNEGGIYVVPVRINGAITLDFIVDSGASDVVLPADVAMTIARTGTITDDDFIGSSEYTLADGSKLKSDRFVLRELKIGDLTVAHVTAIIGSPKAEPLLGQSFLSRLGSWAIDNNRHVLRLSGLDH
jgi:clan AA aspartic protease (TIGR02281 family)